MTYFIAHIVLLDPVQWALLHVSCAEGGTYGRSSGGAPKAGGMQSTSIMRLSIERFSPFCIYVEAICRPWSRWASERVRWRAASMGIFTGGRLHDCGTPVALLKFGETGIISRLRYGLFAFLSVRRNRSDAIETESACFWITRWCGTEAYERLWKSFCTLGRTNTKVQ